MADLGIAGLHVANHSPPARTVLPTSDSRGLQPVTCKVKLRTKCVVKPHNMHLHCPHQEVRVLAARNIEVVATSLAD
jgi:hypothetical protein